MVVDFDPVIFSIGPVEIRWYAMMYVLGFLVGSQILIYLSRQGFLRLEKKKIDTYVSLLMLGMLIGARVFYVFIYNWPQYAQNPGDIIAVWKGGLSFHGGVFGMTLATYYYAKKNGLHFFEMTDSMALAGTIGLFFGRMGNFINGELYGRITDSPFGVIFKGAGPYPRHPSQLYEGLTEGLLLFIILWFLKKRVQYYGVISATFICGYGFFRYIVEFFRQPDPQLGYYFWGTTTMGQILCFLMIIIGIFFYLYARKVKLNVKREAC